MNLDNPRIRKVYGRRQGRPLRGERQECLDNLYPKLAIEKNLLTQDKKLDPKNLFSNKDNPIILEIGFGSGEFLKNNLNINPDTNYIGAEPFINGVSFFLKSIKEMPHDNVRILMDDALLIINSLKDNSIDGIYVLNPDPWHKFRHHKRRMINQDNLDAFSRILKPSSFLTMTSDVDDLSNWMYKQANNHKDFQCKEETLINHRAMPKDWYRTKYELKGKNAGRVQSYLLFEKI
jgi:tRNA (guanine-N7-)-methyltransferase